MVLQAEEVQFQGERWQQYRKQGRESANGHQCTSVTSANAAQLEPEAKPGAWVGLARE